MMSPYKTDTLHTVHGISTPFHVSGINDLGITPVSLYAIKV